jgi:hypothetical protein
VNSWPEDQRLVAATVLQIVKQANASGDASVRSFGVRICGELIDVLLGEAEIREALDDEHLDALLEWWFTTDPKPEEMPES